MSSSSITAGVTSLRRSMYISISISNSSEAKHKKLSLPPHRPILIPCNNHLIESCPCPPNVGPFPRRVWRRPMAMSTYSHNWGPPMHFFSFSFDSISACAFRHGLRPPMHAISTYPPVFLVFLTNGAFVLHEYPSCSGSGALLSICITPHIRAGSPPIARWDILSISI